MCSNFQKSARERLVESTKLRLMQPRRPAYIRLCRPALGGHFKSGQWGWPGTVLFYPFEPFPGKPVLVRQLRGPHLRT